MLHRHFALVCLLSALSASALGEPGSHLQPPVRAGTSCWRGEWREPGPEGACRFEFVLQLANANGNASGSFSWRLLHCAGFEGREGERGVEHVRGTMSASHADLRGLDVTNATLLATDVYRLDFSGDRLSGTTRTNEGDWDGHIQGTRTACP